MNRQDLACYLRNNISEARTVIGLTMKEQEDLAQALEFHSKNFDNVRFLEQNNLTQTDIMSAVADAVHCREKHQNYSRLEKIINKLSTPQFYHKAEIEKIGNELIPIIKKLSSQLNDAEKAPKRLLLIGGFPKGYDAPFHPNTLSGKRLIAIQQKYHFHLEFLDLWKTDQEEKDGIILLNTLASIESFQNSGYEIIALGFHVYNSLKKADKRHAFNLHYLPHPAARREVDLQILEMGLIFYSKSKLSTTDTLRQKIELLKEFYVCKSCHHLARLDKPSEDSILRICMHCGKRYEPLIDIIESLLEQKP